MNHPFSTILDFGHLPARAFVRSLLWLLFLAPAGASDLAPWRRKAALDFDPGLQARVVALEAERNRILEELFALEAFEAVSRQSGEYQVRAKALQEEILQTRERINPLLEIPARTEAQNLQLIDLRKAHQIAVQEHQKTVRALENQGNRVWQEALDAGDAVPADLRGKMAAWAMEQADVENEIAAVALAMLPDWEADLLSMEDPAAAALQAEALLQSNQSEMTALTLRIQDLQRAEWEREPLRTWAADIDGLQKEMATALASKPAWIEVAEREDTQRKIRSAIDSLMQALQASLLSMQVPDMVQIGSARSALQELLGEEKKLRALPEEDLWLSGGPEVREPLHALYRDVAGLLKENQQAAWRLGQAKSEAEAVEIARNPDLAVLNARIVGLREQSAAHLRELPALRPLTAKLQLMLDTQTRLLATRHTLKPSDQDAPEFPPVISPE